MRRATTDISCGVLDRRSIRTTFVVLLGLLTLAATTGGAVAAVPTGNPNVPGKAKPYHEYDEGRGYWVYVCDAAHDAGYKGDLNKAFQPFIKDRDQFLFGKDASDADDTLPTNFAIEPNPPRYALDLSNPTEPKFLKINNGYEALPGRSQHGPNASDLNDHLRMWDDCSANGQSLGVARKDNTQVAGIKRLDFPAWALPFHPPPVIASRGDIGAGWELRVPKNEGLVITRLHVDDRVRSVKTTQPECDWGGTINAPLGCMGAAAPGWGAGWSIVRGAKGLDERVDQFRMCRGHGTWVDGTIENQYWKDLTAGSPGGGGGVWGDYNYTANVYGSYKSPFYGKKYKPGKPGDYRDDMTGSPTKISDPDATCEIKSDGNGNAREWYYSDKRDGAYRVNLLVTCYRTETTRNQCRSLNSNLPWSEAPNARKNFLQHGVRARVNGANFFVVDESGPTLTLGGSLNGGGNLVNDGTTNQENLTIQAEDNAGIRRIRATMSGACKDCPLVVRDEWNHTVDGDVCDYRYPVPCAGAKSATLASGLKPDWAPNVKNAMLGDYWINADDLPTGYYEILVEAWDASNTKTESKVSFRVDQNLHVDCLGNTVQTGAVAATCGGTTPPPGVALGIPPIVVNVPPTTGCAVGAQCIFTYALASNPRSDGVSSRAGDCKLIEHVVSGNGTGGSLNDREKNQIISVTLDLSGYATRGTNLGTQDTRFTFDMPSRRDARYRSALGCSG